jgi:DNA-binding MarR family transcriptional regulator
MTVQAKAAERKANSPLSRPAGIHDMLDYQLYLVYRDCGYVIERVCRLEFGVSRRRWRILAALSTADGATLGDLSKRADLDIAQTSRAIGGLAREGYLRRLANRENARFARIVLTEKGRNLYSSMFARLRQVNQQLLRPLDDDQVEHLLTIISILRTTAKQMYASKSKPANSTDERRQNLLAPLEGIARGEKGVPAGSRHRPLARKYR